MDQEVLVNRDIELGRKLTETLDSSRVPVEGALWFYAPDASEWRLLLATPIVDKKGPAEAYAEIQRSAKDFDWDQLPLRRVSVISPRSDLIRLLRSAIRTGPGISGIRFTHNSVNNVFIEDAYIYRLQ